MRRLFPGIILLVLIIFITNVTMAADFDNCKVITDDQLAAAGNFSLPNLKINPVDMGVYFDYNDTFDSAVHSASGFALVTPVTGDNNNINVDLSLTIYIISAETVDIHLSDSEINSLIGK